MTNDSATLMLGTQDARLRLDWMQYDGDDYFKQHRIEYTDDNGTQRFEFGACAIRCVRKLESLLNAEADSVGFGFRVPEIIYYDVDRVDDSLRLRVHSEALNIDTTMSARLEGVVFDKPFRRYYDSK